MAASDRSELESEAVKFKVSQLW